MTTKIKLDFDNATELANVKFHEGVTADTEYLNAVVTGNSPNVIVADVYGLITGIEGLVTRHSSDAATADVVDTAQWDCTDNGSAGVTLDADSYWKLDIDSAGVKDVSGLNIDVDTFYFGLTEADPDAVYTSETIRPGVISAGTYYVYIDNTGGEANTFGITSAWSTAIDTNHDPLITNATANDGSATLKQSILIEADAGTETGITDVGLVYDNTGMTAHSDFQKEDVANFTDGVYLTFTLTAPLNGTKTINFTIKDDHPSSNTVSIGHINISAEIEIAS